MSKSVSALSKDHLKPKPAPKTAQQAQHGGAKEPDQQHTLTRLHAFLKKYGITYTYLLAGAPAEVTKKLPQAVNLNAWPTSFLVGRDGRVHFVEVGFPSVGSADFYAEAKRRYAANIERLLAVP